MADAPESSRGNVVKRDWYMGLMSGTSFDGVDVAALSTDGESVWEHGRALTMPLRDAARHALRAVMGQRTAPESVVELVTQTHIEALEAFFARHGRPQNLCAIGFHGQTIFHRPEAGLTFQIGDGQRLANRFGVPVVEQFRVADVTAGGEGAPIAPVYHRALLNGGPLPAVFVNIGGVSNVTWSDGLKMIAFDTGVGNARLDDWMRNKASLDFDPDGRFGLSGTADETLVQSALEHPFLRPPAAEIARSRPDCLPRDGAAVARRWSSDFGGA